MENEGTLDQKKRSKQVRRLYVLRSFFARVGLSTMHVYMLSFKAPNPTRVQKVPCTTKLQWF